MAPTGGAVDHVLPIISQAKLNKRFQHRVPNALFGPSPEPDVNRIPLAISLMHVAPRAADPQNMQHATEKAPVVLGGLRPPPALGRQKRFDDGPFPVGQIASSQECPLKSILESEPQ